MNDIEKSKKDYKGVGIWLGVSVLASVCFLYLIIINPSNYAKDSNSYLNYLKEEVEREGVLTPALAASIAQNTKNKLSSKVSE